MSIGRTHNEVDGLQSSVPKKTVDLQKVTKKMVKEFTENTPGVLFGVVICITGIGEIIGTMSVQWYIFLFFMLVFYAATFFFIRMKPLTDLFSEK